MIAIGAGPLSFPQRSWHLEKSACALLSIGRSPEGASEEEKQTDAPDGLPMICNRCGRKLKLRNDGWRRCGKGCSEVMGIELRVAMMPSAEHQQTEILPSQPFIPRLKPTWKSDAN